MIFIYQHRNKFEKSNSQKIMTFIQILFFMMGKSLKTQDVLFGAARVKTKTGGAKTPPVFLYVTSC